MARLKYNFTWKKYHRWLGLVLSVFMLVFCVSGIILNHREVFSGCEVSRKWLPASYHIKNFNNGVVKGTVVKKSAAHSLSSENCDSVLAYGCAGVFLTDSRLSTWQDFNAGLPESIDERNVRHVVKAKNGSLWCAALRDVYRYDENSHRWKKVELPGNEERIMDVALAKDSMTVVALTRSRVFTIVPFVQYGEIVKIGKSSSETYRVESKIIPAPKKYEPKTTLFKLVWHLHSGEFFGLPGKLVVDAIALVLIVLSITGILLFILPYGIRRAKKLAAKARMKRLGKQFAWNMKWHNKIGYVTIVLTLWIAITGMCLRPPLMVPLVLSKLPQTVGEDGNVWQDKLRAIRWDAVQGDWLVSTSEGFLRVDEGFSQAPKMLPDDECPKLSPMGVTVWESDGKGGWIVGSFRGIYRWNPVNHSLNQILDYFTGKPSEETSMIPISDNLVCGYSEDFLGGKPLVFDFAKGVEDAKGQAVALCNDEPKKSRNEESMSDLICETTPMSLWNVALELHVGRCYSPFLGPLSDLFVFLSGLLITLVLLSGYIISHRRRKKAQARLK
ncbi:MAG: PepSY-associated TM helix domain-containing protein [Prevotella sp.]|nr:PepSY-associated TM helix domain-containing protein [uncultured Prevotella sp.]MED9898002.1 PepSY-associated TM helix domain-containing protein [Prevotella sp.]